MNLTMLPLEDTLVEEITEHERGECELAHIVSPVCTIAVVGVLATKCSPITQLSCAAGVKRFLESMAYVDTVGTGCTCWRSARDCWSVVMLP